MQVIHYLSGLPRTGSTLLGSILNQNPRIHVSPTSALYPLLVSTTKQINFLNQMHTFDAENLQNKLYRTMIKTFYSDIKKPIIFDKHRGWPNDCDAIRKYISPSPRIVCTVRPIPEIIASYIKLADKDENNFIDNHLKKFGDEINNFNRAELIWGHYLKPVYDGLMGGLERDRNCIHLVEYSDLVNNPESTIRGIYKFCGIPEFSHKFNNIKNTCAETKDFEGWGMKNLHTIRPDLAINSDSPNKYLHSDVITYLNQFNIKAA